MLFGKHKRKVKRILIVEDEPLTAFDNETMLSDAGYEVVATIDKFEDALEVIEREPVDLIVSDVRLRSQQTGIDLARAAKEKGIPTLFATGHPYPEAAAVAVGCLMKPYTERQLKGAIEAVDRFLSGEAAKPPKGLELFGGSPQS
ncbi:MAG: response regulator [Sphingomicrobium sp.]